MDAQRWHVELFEDIGRLTLVRDNYQTCIKRLQSEGHKIFTVDGNEPIEVVRKNIFTIVKRAFSESGYDSSEQLDLIESVETDKR